MTFRVEKERCFLWQNSENSFHQVKIQVKCVQLAFTDIQKLPSLMLQHDNVPVHRSILVSNYRPKHHIHVFSQSSYFFDPVVIFYSDEEFAGGATILKFRRSAATKTLEKVAKGGL
ncbi:hypothetical protein AVEN_101398-1 [Araneus ventricosus]|uniref:Uncharacterized protein n=1 Tax=Araneus ventricosus TaxID=182803 RepID=A0A4Y2MX01_ARAVE|nr:hypothetical protein AVEN_101398-1 [Araneus ventricosus]